MWRCSGIIPELFAEEFIGNSSAHTWMQNTGIGDRRMDRILFVFASCHRNDRGGITSKKHFALLILALCVLGTLAEEYPKN